jgi:hypothetical protein
MSALRFEKLTPAQTRVLGEIALGNDSGHHLRVLAALEAGGYIVAQEETLGGRFPVTIVRYAVPIPVHMRWCAWCATLPEFEP